MLTCFGQGSLRALFIETLFEILFLLFSYRNWGSFFFIELWICCVVNISIQIILREVHCYLCAYVLILPMCAIDTSNI